MINTKFDEAGFYEVKYFCDFMNFFNRQCKNIAKFVSKLGFIIDMHIQRIFYYNLNACLYNFIMIMLREKMH